MNWINNFLNRINMYRLMLYYLRVLIGVSVVLSYFEVITYTWWHILALLAAFMIGCLVANWLFAWLFNVKPNYESQYITAEILTLIVGPFNPLDNWLFLVVLCVIAMGSKYLLAINKRHLFNPAAVASVGTALLMGEAASWWIGNPYLLPVVAIGGILMAYKLKYFHLIFSFVITYSVLTVGLNISNDIPWQDSLLNLRNTFIYSSVIFFATVMLTEPLTSPARVRNRIAYGAFTAAVMIAIQTYYTSIFYNFELSLIIGNVFAFILSPNPKIRLRLTEKLYFARNSMILAFVPEKSPKFLPGQYMQFIVNHDKPDNRGTRRFFSIASSPTEDNVMLATKFAEESSTFKLALKDMQEDQSILASSLDGDFVLPKSPKNGLVFIAGGVGIAPFRSMIKYLLDKNLKYDIALFYANKDYDEIGFTEIFDEAEEKLGIKTFYLLNGKQPNNWTGFTGFLTPKIIRQQVNAPETKIYYLSGPDPMVRSYVKMLKEMGIKNKQIKTDYFPGYD